MPLDQFGDQVSVPLPLAIAIGAFNASASVLKGGHRTGYNTAPTVNVAADIRAGTFNQQAATGQRQLSSSSAADAAAGTGARTVQINYLDSNMVMQSEIVTLNGTTPVNTASSDVWFIESMQVLTAGTGLANVGDISLKTAGGGATMAQILAVSPNQSFFCHHYVPAGVTCYVIKLAGSTTAAIGRSALYQLGDPRTPGPATQLGDIICNLLGGFSDTEYEYPLVVAGPNVILARQIPVASVGGNQAYAGFDYIEF